MIKHCLLSIRFVSGLVLVLFAFLVSAAPVDDAVLQCIKQKVAFDGIKPLRYAAATGEKGSRVELFHDHPATCDAAKDSACKGKAYLVAGDTVAVANTCGSYAHVQFIGEKTVSYGWVEITRLGNSRDVQPREITSDTMPTDVGPKRTRDPDHFLLTKGRGAPVCEAYLQRLNLTISEHPPFCEREESDLVPGFTKLSRVQLSAATVNRLRLQELNLVYFVHKSKKASDRYASEYREGFDPSIWRYGPAVDIDNDGSPDNVVIWNEGIQDGCGYKFPTTGDPPILIGWPLQLALVLNADDSQIDEAKTTEFFGNPVGGYAIAFDFKRGFRPIGDSMRIFRFRNLNYLDAFLSFGDYATGKTNTPKPQNHLGVFLRQKNSTQQVCEYVLKGYDSYVPFIEGTPP